MKRKANLYPLIYTEENIKKAILEASKGKRHRSDVQKILADPEPYVKKIQYMLKNECFTPSDYTRQIIQDGTHHKKREIFKPHFYPDQIVHWCIYLILRDWIYKGMYEYSCGSIPGRGIHYGKKAVEKWIKNDFENTQYYLKLDVKKYYPSIKPVLLMKKIKRKIKDKKLLNLLEIILTKEDGLPIGMLLSQIFANYYATDLDFYIKQDLKAKYYIRYMDDMIIFDKDKTKLHIIRKAIIKKFAENGLTIKNNWQVYKLENQPLDFMGFRFYRYKTTIRKSIMLRITRKMKTIYKKEKITFNDAGASLSYMGWIKNTDSYILYKTRIRPYINEYKMKSIIRKEQRKRNVKVYKSEYFNSG